MLRTMFTGKIHRATVTHADLHYVGSVTVDLDLLEAADILPGQLVHIVDITNGARLETYTIPGERGSGVLGINGAAARLIQPGDVVILIAYAQMDDDEARTFQPTVVHVDAENRIVVPLNSISVNMQNAIVAVEDQRGGGVDALGGGAGGAGADAPHAVARVRAGPPRPPAPGHEAHRRRRPRVQGERARGGLRAAGRPARPTGPSATASGWSAAG